MDKKRTSLIADEIQKLRKEKDLALTIFGAISLSPFSRKTILKSKDKFRQVRGKFVKLDKPFNYFLALCMETAQALKEEPKWNKTLDLCKYYNVEHGSRVTEENEFLSDSPLLVKKAVDALVKEHSKPRSKYMKSNEVKKGPQFSGDTYVKYGKTYLRPKETKVWSDPDIEERLEQPPEYWQEEKRKFLEIAKQGKVNVEGIKYLVAIGMLKYDDIRDMVHSSHWKDTELSAIIETHRLTTLETQEESNTGHT